jgi:L-ascorbate metabolism protein UlaG (beta-lactamase superfamily)
MTKRLAVLGVTLASLVGMLILLLPPSAAQGQGNAAARAQWARDFNGVWSPVGGTDITRNLLPGEEISLTRFGAEQYNKIDEGDSPAYDCMPYGPTRMMSSALPFRIYQQNDEIGMVFEHIDYRLIYMNGKHPEDILDYPEWAGNSIGRWEGDTLVVDTIGMREESWLDSHGLQHSGQLHLVERYTKTSPDTYIWKVTVEDPVYYTKPFTYAFNVERNPFRIVPNRCEDTPSDEKYNRIRGKVGPEHAVTPTFPPGVARTYIGHEKAEGTGRGTRRPAAPLVKKTKADFQEDVLQTSQGELKITWLANYSLRFGFNGKIVDVDPIGQTADYTGLPKADVILVTNLGPNHLDLETIKSLSTNRTELIVCPHCSLDLPNGSIMINGETRTVGGFKIEAVPAYNIKGQGGNGKPYTSKSTANGYVITFGDKRVFVSGETENVPEVKALKQIDLAFLSVNETGIGVTATNNSGLGVVLRTMTPAMFADTVKAMRPKIVFPYAYGKNDPKDLAALVSGESGIEVRAPRAN